MTDVLIPLSDNRRLTATEFQGLSAVPAEAEWFANIANKNTRRVYKNALKDFIAFVGIAQQGDFRSVTRAHVIAWRDDLLGRALSGMTIRHRLRPLLAVRASMQQQRRHAQPGEGRQAPRR